MTHGPWLDHSFATKLCEIYTWQPREIGNDWRKVPWMFAQRALFLEMHHTYAWNLIKPTSTKFTSPPAQVDPTQFLLIMLFPNLLHAEGYSHIHAHAQKHFQDLLSTCGCSTATRQLLWSSAEKFARIGTQLCCLQAQNRKTFALRKRRW